MDKFLTVFNADYTESKKGQNWTLLATPKISNVAEFLKSITLIGNPTDLKQIVIKYTNKTTIIIDFKHMKTDSTDEIKC